MLKHMSLGVGVGWHFTFKLQLKGSEMNPPMGSGDRDTLWRQAGTYWVHSNSIAVKTQLKFFVTLCSFLSCDDIVLE